jgi:hypothetical protein
MLLRAILWLYLVFWGLYLLTAASPTQAVVF